MSFPATTKVRIVLHDDNDKSVEYQEITDIFTTAAFLILKHNVIILKHKV